MPVKFFCDECGMEVDNPSSSLDMTGKILCGKHYQEYINQNKNYWVYSKVWDKDRFKFPKGIRRTINNRRIV